MLKQIHVFHLSQLANKVLPCDKTADLLQCDVAFTADRTESTASYSYVVACNRGRVHVKSIEPLPSNVCVYRAVPKQQPSLLASQSWLSADMPQD
jgi:hypothetical protein